MNHPAGILITLLVIVGCGAATPREQRQAPKPAEQPASLDLGCKLVSDKSEPVRLQCELRNKGKRPANELRVVVVVNGVSRPGIAPKQLAPGEAVTLELAGAEPTQSGEDADHPVGIIVTGADIATTTQILSTRVPGFAAICQGKKLTRRQVLNALRQVEDVRDIVWRTEADRSIRNRRDKSLDEYVAAILRCAQ